MHEAPKRNEQISTGDSVLLQGRLVLGDLPPSLPALPGAQPSQLCWDCPAHSPQLLAQAGLPASSHCPYRPRPHSQSVPGCLGPSQHRHLPWRHPLSLSCISFCSIPLDFSTSSPTKPPLWFIPSVDAHLPHFGREINSRLSGQTAICSLNKAVSS